MERVQREAVRDRDPHHALVGPVDDFDRHLVRPRLPEERDFEAVLRTVGELSRIGN
jgi:hypothetical protein